MKKFQLFILVLLSSSITVHACGYYPWGEDLRFCFFKPEYYGFKRFSEFNYSGYSFAPGAVYDENETTPNIALWYTYCKGKVNPAAITEAVYEINAGDITSHSGNAMLRYLYAVKDKEAIAYLKFAKGCELFNQTYADPWERNEGAKIPNRSKLEARAAALASATVNKDLKLRYAFLAIRLAHYNTDTDTLKKLYATYFAKADKDILYYWSLYFNTLSEQDQPFAGFCAAQVFGNAPDKRFAVLSSFKDSIPLGQMLKYAVTNEERANVHLIAGVRKSDRAFTDIMAMYKENPHCEGLSFLLLREVNKIEDWVYTPYYSLFSPSLQDEYYGDGSDALTTLAVLKRVEGDRQYAARLLAFVNSVAMQKVYNPQFWQMAKAQLQFITKQYAASLQTIKAIEKNGSTETESYKQLERIKALAIIASDANSSTEIPDAVKNILLKNNGNGKFIFAAGRELEYKGNTTDAALLYSQLNESASDTPYWKTKKNKGDTYGDYYSNYFDYVNVAYTPQQLTALVNNIKDNTATDTFSVWKYRMLKNSVPEFYDLLGTMYIRQNQLQQALSAFSKVKSLYDDKSYPEWAKNNYYGSTFDKNPFYSIRYTPDFIPKQDSIALNKYTITHQLIKYRSRAVNPAEKDRDYYYFLVANCYYNMSHYGNAWMMRRFTWNSSGYFPATVLSDNNEYYECNYARQYYTLAMKHAKTKKFKALCLRMIALCDTNRDCYATKDEYNDKAYISPYYKILKNKYPQYYDDLTGSSCTKFEDYFKARR